MSAPTYPAYWESGAGWLGAIPLGWGVKPVAAVATCNDEVLDDSTPSDYRINYIEISDVDATMGITGYTTLEFGTAPSRARRLVQDGDVIISTVRTYLKAIAAVKAPTTNTVVSTGFAVMRPRTIDPGFLAYMFRCEFFIAEIIARSVGVSYPAINASEICRLQIPVPSQTEQSAIAAFLDHEIGKIDILVAEQGRLMGLLKEKRQAVIFQAVTKGLKPNAPMKDSGVEWLGAVPQAWEIIQLGKVTNSKCDGPFGSGLKSEHYTDEGVRVVRLQNIKAGEFFPVDAAYITKEYFDECLARHDVRAGDILIAGLGDERNTVGRACVAPQEVEPAMVKADCFRFRLNEYRALPTFVAMQLSAGSSYDAGILSTGSTRSRIPLSEMARRKLALPPLDEQGRVVVSVQAMIAKFTELSAKAEAAIELLRERRAALISAAVTGKIDIRGVACPPVAQAA